jgi:drug/metabolite transporter (DMT)-like permease
MLGVATLFWGMTFVVIKPLVRSVPPLPLVALRFLLAAALLAPAALRRSRRPSPGLLLRGVGMGVVLFGGYFLQTAGLVHTGAGKSAFITSLYVVLTPVVLAVTGWRRLPWHRHLPALGALGGMYLLADPSGGLNPGDALTVGSALCWAVHLALIDRYTTRGDELMLCLVQLATVGAVSLAAAAVSGWGSPGLGPAELLGLLYLALPATVLVVLWQLRWQPLLGAAPSALIYIGEAVVAAAGGVLLFGESMDARGWVGAAAILASTYWSVYAAQRRSRKASLAPSGIAER